MLRKIFCVLLCTSVLTLCTVAQQTEKVTVKSGEDVAAVLSSYGMYRFPDFLDGMVWFRNGSNAGGKMNYNIYLGLIQFIDAKGDTLAISNPETIDSATIGDNLFYYRNGYLQVVSQYANCQIIMQQKIEFLPVKVGAMGIPATGTGAQTYESFSSPSTINKKLTFNEDIVVLKKTSYVLSYKKYRQTPADMRGFLNAFPSYKIQIQSFAEANKTDFTKLEDIKKLATFCASLQ